MTIQTVELAGQRFVIVPEEYFRSLERRAGSLSPAQPLPEAAGKSKFASITPLKVTGIPASEILVQDRR